VIVVFDLDDTLYDEVDFVASGFAAVAEFIACSDADYALELSAFLTETFLERGSKRIFDQLIEQFALNQPLARLVDIYRFHWPQIELPHDRRRVLDAVANRHGLGLLTDGHYLTQSNKFARLGLQRWIEAPVFHDQLGATKPDPRGFEGIAARFVGERFVYVADNPQKDFTAPRQMGWHTIRFRNPRGIYRQYTSDADLEVAELWRAVEVIEGWAARG
jgi:putative hydrolase of the HAD superfamily